MRKLLFFFVIATVFVSCSDENDPLQKDEIETISGVFDYDQPQTIEFGGKTFTLLSEGMDGSEQFEENPSLTKANGTVLYTTIPTYTTPIKNTKVLLNGVSGLATGSYLCDVCSFNKIITLPSNAVAGIVMAPSPAGYSNYSNQTRGINWTITSTSSSVTLSMSFNTIIINYDMVGREYGWVRPLDGRTVSIPYYFIYP
ncbi:MAG: hypothetical protein LBL58_02685 [Tannerellaceae bacterium]|jgi:hypothetical protein|nr:hypothetical protein [Tannerellaceae bacterium]